ncbi:hypothetical protein K3495_g3523 [Podosphaera aphanis]|nr:hypothetical protein K3495_g3523 [Podosphaera aphanis]
MNIFATRRIGAASKKTVPRGDVFTAFYSTILATAAVADSAAKEKRSREWDKKIAEAREILSGRENYSTFAGPPEYRLESTESISSSSDVYASNSEISAYDKSRIVSKRRPRRQYTTPYPVAYLLPDYDKYHLNRSLRNRQYETSEFTHEEPDPDVPERNISDPNEIRILQKNISNLVENLLAASTFYWSSSTVAETATDPDTLQQLEVMKQRLKTLELSFEQLPLYSDESPERAQEQTKELNVILWNICRVSRIEETSLNLMIAKLCYNLLISATPPNIETYNILLIQFAGLERHDLARSALESFWESGLRPNKRTIELIIKHYKATKDKEGLTDLVKQMRGVSGNLMLICAYAKDYRLQWPSVEGYRQGSKGFDLDSPEIRKHMREHRLYYRSGYLYRKWPRDRHIFDALITAHLELKGLRSATRCFAAAVREGETIKCRTLCALIDKAIERGDFTTGLKILMVILSQWKTSGCHLLFRFILDVRYHINRLLYLCGIHINQGIDGHLPRRLVIYTEAMVIKESEYPKDALRKMLIHMKTVSLEEALDRHSLLLESLREVLLVPESTSCLVVGLEQALALIKNAAEKERTIERMLNDAVQGKELEILGLQANSVTTFSKMEEISTGLAMIRVKRCALKLNELSAIVSRTKDSEIKMQRLENLSLHLGVLHMQLKLEIHLNLWWIRRLGIVASTYRATVQRKRLNFIFENLNVVELKINAAWHEFTARIKIFN